MSVTIIGIPVYFNKSTTSDISACSCYCLLESYVWLKLRQCEFPYLHSFGDPRRGLELPSEQEITLPLPT